MDNGIHLVPCCSSSFPPVPGESSQFEWLKTFPFFFAFSVCVSSTVVIWTDQLQQCYLICAEIMTNQVPPRVEPCWPENGPFVLRLLLFPWWKQRWHQVVKKIIFFLPDAPWQYEYDTHCLYVTTCQRRSLDTTLWWQFMYVSTRCKQALFS